MRHQSEPRVDPLGNGVHQSGRITRRKLVCRYLRDRTQHANEKTSVRANERIGDHLTPAIVGCIERQVMRRCDSGRRRLRTSSARFAK